MLLMVEKDVFKLSTGFGIQGLFVIPRRAMSMESWEMNHDWSVFEEERED